MSEQPHYQPGQIVNGHVWTGDAWVPVQQPPAPPQGKSSWRIIAAVLSFFAAAVAGLFGLSWLSGFYDLQNEGNQFAGLLLVFGLGALAVAAGFGITGIVLLTKKS